MPITPAVLHPHFLSVSLPLFFCPSLPFSLSECVFLNRLTVIWRHCASLPLNITSVYFLKPRTVLLHDQRCRNEEINLDKTLPSIAQTVLGFQQLSYLSLGRDVFSGPGSNPGYPMYLSCLISLVFSDPDQS